MSREAGIHQRGVTQSHGRPSGQPAVNREVFASRVGLYEFCKGFTPLHHVGFYARGSEMYGVTTLELDLQG